jgi:hypothetical protein
VSIEQRNMLNDHERRLQALENAFAESSKQFAQQVNDELFGAAAEATKKTLTLPEKRQPNG